MVLDGAIDPSVSGLDVSTTQAIGFESALRAYMADCLAGRGCPFSGTVDQAMADLGTLLASVDAKPLQGDDGRMLGADTLMTGIIAALYAQDSWPYLTQALSQALQGDPSTALLLADFYNGRNDDGTYSDNSAEAFRAYNCMDYPLDTSQADQDASTALIAQKAPTVAPYWQGVDVCAVWPYPPTGVRERITAEHLLAGHPVRVVGVARRTALLGRAHHPRGRGSHRLQQGQHVRRQRGRGLPRRRHGAAERSQLLTARLRVSGAARGARARCR
jgi:hypothetical protein